MVNLSIAEGIGLVAAAIIVYNIALIVYWLYFHPLAKFPGPKLTAVSYWYEFYWDVFHHGQFMYRIGDMHKQYGPIVRITPDELHINDPEYYDEIYAGAHKKRDRYAKWKMSAGAPNSTFSTIPHDFHRRRRAAINPFFAKRSVVRLEPRIASKVERLCERYSEEMRKGTVVDAHAAYIALTADVITEYCYGYNQDHLGSPDFSKDLKDIMITLFQGLQVRRQVPLLMYVMVELPADWLLKMIIPSLGAMIDFQNYLEREVKRVVKRKKTDAKAEEKESILTTLLDNPDLPPQEKTVPRMKDEAFVLIAAGAETTGKTLAETTFHILNTPGVLPRLREELKTVMPKSTDLPTWSQLEQLPYLNACVSEGLRIMLGITTRMPRIPHEVMTYGDWVIPARTPVSQISYFTHTNPEIFPDPFEFKPERWLDKSQGKRLDRYMTTFTRGTRACVGMNLAYAELFLTLAATFRRFDLELYETTIDDIRMAKDGFVAYPKPESKGVRIRVKGELD